MGLWGEHDSHWGWPGCEERALEAQGRGTLTGAVIGAGGINVSGN